MTAALDGSEWSAALPGRTLPPGKTRYPFYRRLRESQGRSGRVENLVPTGIQSRTVQPVVSRYTDWATGPTTRYIYHINLMKSYCIPNWCTRLTYDYTDHAKPLFLYFKDSPALYLMLRRSVWHSFWLLGYGSGTLGINSQKQIVYRWPKHTAKRSWKT
jgi:hypothetical protein